MGFPFTNAQWKELERQALIYKYMVASIPIPIDLLIPIPISTTTTTTTSSSNPNNNNNNNNNNTLVNWKADMEEAGRCKRTDGKKWRCSRHVAPNQKYCERHVNRGRPRSRKHVEPQQQSLYNNNNTKKLPHRFYDNHHSRNHNSILTPTTTNNNNQTPPFLGGGGGRHSSLPYYHQYPYHSSTDSPLQSRRLEWMMRKEHQNQEQEWLRLMQSRMEITEKPEEESFLNIDCTTTTTTTSSLYYDADNDVVSDQTATSFIDAWSKTTTTVDDDDDDNNETTEIWNLSPSSLTLSMGNWVNPSSSDSGSWVSPLAEVLRRSAAGFGGGSDTPPAVSPLGVLQKTTMTSLSDSSNCSSRTAKPKPEIALF